MFTRNLFRFAFALYIRFYIVTTTMHMYHVCIQENIISDFQPEPGLKLSGYVQMFLTRETPDDIHTLVTSAHQLCDTFYKTIVQEGSEMHLFDAILNKTIRAMDLDILTSKRLVENARMQFRKIRENVIFLEKDILALFIDYKTKSYQKSDCTVSDRKDYLDYFDQFLRIWRKQASDVKARAQALNEEALKKDNDGYSNLTVLLFITAYGAISLAFLRKHILFILLCFLAVVVLCLVHVNIQFEDAKVLRAKAAKNIAEYHDIIQEIRQSQDNLLRSRNDTVSYFVKTADPMHVKQVSFLLVTFTELVRGLNSIDVDLKKLTSLTNSLEVSKAKKKDNPRIMKDLKLTSRNTIKSVQKIFTILQ